MGKCLRFFIISTYRLCILWSLDSTLLRWRGRWFNSQWSMRSIALNRCLWLRNSWNSRNSRNSCVTAHWSWNHRSSRDHLRQSCHGVENWYPDSRKNKNTVKVCAIDYVIYIDTKCNNMVLSSTLSSLKRSSSASVALAVCACTGSLTESIRNNIRPWQLKLKKNYTFLI